MSKRKGYEIIGKVGGDHSKTSWYSPVRISETRQEVPQGILNLLPCVEGMFPQTVREYSRASGEEGPGGGALFGAWGRNHPGF